MYKLWNQPELLRNTLHGLTALLDMARIEIAEWRCHLKVAHPIGINPHQSAASCVSGDRIICEDEAAKTPHRTVQRPIALHGLNPVGNYKVNRDRHCELDDGVVDALPVQDVFGQASH